MSLGYSRMYPARRARLLAALTLLALALLAGCARIGGPSAPIAHQPTATPAPISPPVWHQATLPDGFTPPGGPEGRNDGFAVSPADGQSAWACAPVAASPGSFTIWATHDTAATWRQVATLVPQAAETPRSCLLVADQNDPHALMAGFRWVASASGSPRWVSYLSSDDGASWQPLPGELRPGSLATSNGVRYAVVYDISRINDYGSIAAISSAGGALNVRLTSFQPLVPNVFILSLWAHPPDPVL
ncbi:MAG TPA: hypothetical protein VID73_02405, partial [Ktedonobacterales bacterium]